MADTNLSTSISAIRTKILNDAPTATVDELGSLARAAKSIGLTEDTTIETAINSRANTLSSNASTNDMVKLSNAIKQLRNTTAGAVSPSTTTDDIVEGTSNFYYTDAKVQTKLGDVSGHIIPDTNATYDIGSAEKKIRHLYLSSNSLKLGSINISDNNGSLEVTPVDGEGAPKTLSGGAAVYEDMNALIAATGMSNGDIALVTATNNIYIYNGSGWYKIATVQNDSPSAITGVDGTYELATDGTATVITAVSTDPEGFPLTWSYSTSGLGSIATISQADNVFTITPSTDTANIGTFTLTINATDGVNGAVSANTSITLQFIVREAFAPSGAELNATVNISTISTNGGGPSINDAGSLAFKPDGTRMYVMNSTNFSERVIQFDLSTPWDISTASYAGDTQFDQVPAFLSHGIHLKPDGTRFYAVSYASNNINLYYYNLSTAWDISSHSRSGGNSDGSTSFSGLSVSKDLYIKPDGTKVFLTAGDASAPAVYTFGTAWEFTGGVTNDTASRNVVGGVEALSVTFKSDGTLMFILDRTGNRLIRYTLSTAWVPSSGTITDELDMSTLGITLGYWNWITLSEDGTRLYYTNETSNIYEYLLE